MPLQNAIQLPDGVQVRGRGLRHPLPPGDLPEHGLYLGSAHLRNRHDHTLSWDHKWLDWPDFWLPRDPEQAVRAIGDLHRQAAEGRRVEVACAGGIGRTGTVLACLAVLAGVPTTDAVDWVRANYHPRAVETPWQRRWVRRFPGS